MRGEAIIATSPKKPGRKEDAMKLHATVLHKIVGVLVILFMSNASAQWVKTNGPYGGWISGHFAVGNSTVLAGEVSGIYRSTDNGMHWIESDKGMWNLQITSLGFYKNNFLAGATDGTNMTLFLSTDSGQNWNQINTISPSQSITCFAGADSVLIAGTSGDGTYRSADGGFHWAKAGNAGLVHPVSAIAVIDSHVFVGTQGGGAYVSTDNGDDWTMLPPPDYNHYVTSLAVSGNILYAAYGSAVYSSTDYGTTWSKCSNGLPSSDFGSLVTGGTDLYFGSRYGMYMTTDGGNSWKSIGLSSAIIQAEVVSQRDLIVGTTDVGIFVSGDNGNNWMQTGPPSNMLVQALASVDSNLVVGDNGVEGILLSTDNGNSFSHYDNLSHSYVLCLKVSGKDIYAGTEQASDSGGGVFESPDGGMTWSRIGLKNGLILSLALDSSNLFAGSDQGVFRTSDGGATWALMNNGLGNTGTGVTSTAVSAIELIDTVVYAGTSGGIWRSTDNGANWTFFGFKDTAVTSLLGVGTTLFAGTPYGIYRNDGAGSGWMRTGFADTSADLIGTRNQMIFARTVSRLYVSRNDASSWADISDTVSTEFSCFATNDIYVFGGTWGTGVQRRLLSEIVTGVSPDRNILPVHFALEQNFPNPFNPTTTIDYQLPKAAHVTIKVYDVLGREVATLVAGQEPAGYHEVSFNGSQFASGVYFYKMTSGNHTAIKKLMLIK